MARIGYLRSVTVSAAVVLAVLAAVLVALVVPSKPAQAAFPGQNGNIAFSGYDWEESGRYYIFAGSTKDGAVATKVPGTQGGDSPSYSPDGLKLAFVLYSGNNSNIYTIPANGGTPTPLLAENTTYEDSPAWSADGESIVYSSYDGSDVGIYTVPVSGGTPTQLTNDGGTPTWSPDGKTIAYSGRDVNGYSQIFTVPTSGGTPVQLTNSDVASAYDPNYSPDGKTIAYTSEDGVSSDIYVVPATGGTPANLTEGWPTGSVPWLEPSDPVRGPAWSPDGSKIVFSGGWDAPQLYTIPASGGTPTYIPGATMSAYDAWRPDWQPVTASTNTAPTITDVRPRPGSTTTDRTPTIAATVTDQQTNLAKTNITLTLDGQTIPRSAFSYNRSTDILTYTPAKKLKWGRHNVRVTAKDEANLSTTKNWGFEIVHP